MPDSSEHPDDMPRRTRRPRSDHATLLSLVVAVLALGWTIYAYYYPQAAPVAVPPISLSPTTSAPAVTASAPAPPPASPSKQIGAWFTRVGDWVDEASAKLNDRYDEDRHDRSRWSLLLTWCFMTGLMLWFIADGLRVIVMPLMQLAYIHYYTPSLSGWGIAASIIGAILATTAAIIVRLEQG
ncbi:hypothetical protein [Actinoplanes sp. NPDC020271]|uniref:hypothetical protein n=1 Tax=Actinoplanes sp. NPDC020271 TaxID=3363896 RepID=UPI0037A175E0